MMDAPARLQEVETVTFTDKLHMEGTWGTRALGRYKSSMTLHLQPDRKYGFIEWDIPGLDMCEEIGLWFEDDVLMDYDGVMSLPHQAAALLSKHGFKVEDEDL